MPNLRPAVFLDRDGTLNVERSYLTRPEQMRILPGVPEGLRQLRTAGFVCVVVTNQSAIGRGMMTLADLERVHAEMERQLADAGAGVDGIYACPAAVDHPDRKPAPGLLLRAAHDLQLDVPRSWMIGDSLRDILAGQNAGCRGCIHVRTGNALDEAQSALAGPFHVADDLVAAARHVIENRIPRSPEASG